MNKLLFVLLLIAFYPSSAQQPVWTSFEELSAKLQTERRPVLLFIHTDWCKFCKAQENKTFTNQELVQLLNEQYYLVRVDAEHAGDILFLGRTYPSLPNDYHSLAQFLGKQNGALEFPTTVLLSEQLQLSKRMVGYVGAEELIELLR